MPTQVSPALAIINSIAQERLRLGDAFEGPERVLLTWAARHKAEFTVLEASLIAICACAASHLKQSNLSEELHVSAAPP